MTKQKPKNKIYFNITAENVFWSLMIGSLVAVFYHFVLNKDPEQSLCLGGITTLISSFLSAWKVSDSGTYTTTDSMEETRQAKQLLIPSQRSTLAISKKLLS